MTSIRSPYEKLAGCYYLARLTHKIRLEQAGELPEDYRPYLFHKRGADSQFLRFFNLTKEELIEAVRASNNDDNLVAGWFEQRTSLDDEKRNNWNALAENFGKPGYPMAKTLVWAKENLLPNGSDPTIDTVFKAIEWDEKR